MMRERNVLTSFVTFAVSLFLVILFATPAPALEKARISNLNGGWQLWIEGADYDSVEGANVKTLTDAGLYNEWKPWFDENDPWLSEDILISRDGADGFARYEFDSPIAGDAHVYGRVQSTYNIQEAGIGTQSWFLMLNTDSTDGNVVFDAPGEWTWNAAREGSLSPTPLNAGANFVIAKPREWEPGRDPALDVILISTVALEPTNEMFQNAVVVGPAAVHAVDKLATTWGTIKGSF